MQSRLRRQHLTSRKRHVAQLYLDATVACWEVVVLVGIAPECIYLSTYHVRRFCFCALELLSSLNRISKWHALTKKKSGGLSATKDLPKPKKLVLGGDQGDLELLKPGDAGSSSQDVSLTYVFH